MLSDGDNLSTIAKNYGVSLDSLYELNSSIDRSTGLIEVGQELILENVNKPESGGIDDNCDGVVDDDCGI